MNIMKKINYQLGRQYLNKQRGVAAVEFAFILPIMLLIFAGIAEFGRTFWYYDALAKATRDGARIMSMHPQSTIQSIGIGAAKSIVVNTANSAGISPNLTAADVSITCLNASFSPVACQDKVAPENIEVTISGYAINIGQAVPFFSYNVLLAPHTIMRYMI